MNVCICNIAFNVAVQVKVHPLVLLCVFIWLADLLWCHLCRFFTLCFDYLFILFLCFLKVQAKHGAPLTFQWLLSFSQSVRSWRYGTDGCSSGLHPKPLCSAANKMRKHSSYRTLASLWFYKAVNSVMQVFISYVLIIEQCFLFQFRTPHSLTTENNRFWQTRNNIIECNFRNTPYLLNHGNTNKHWHYAGNGHNPNLIQQISIFLHVVVYVVTDSFHSKHQTADPGSGGSRLMCCSWSWFTSAVCRAVG